MGFIHFLQNLVCFLFWGYNEAERDGSSKWNWPLHLVPEIRGSLSVWADTKSRPIWSPTSFLSHGNEWRVSDVDPSINCSCLTFKTLAYCGVNLGSWQSSKILVSLQFHCRIKTKFTPVDCYIKSGTISPKRPPASGKRQQGVPSITPPFNWWCNDVQFLVDPCNSELLSWNIWFDYLFSLHRITVKVSTQCSIQPPDIASDGLKFFWLVYSPQKLRLLKLVGKGWILLKHPTTRTGVLAK